LFVSLALAVAAALWSMPAHASTVALSALHMAAVPGANRPAVKNVKSGIKTVYFDYSVVTESSDSGVVDVLAGGIHGNVVASASLFFGTQNSLYVSLPAPGKGAWAVGGFCTVLLVDGLRTTMNGQMPLAWSVGSAHPPQCKPPKATPMTATATGNLRANKSGAVVVTVKSPRGPVSGATVKLDGSSVGISKIRQETTGSKGTCTFSKVTPRRAGTITITATKAKYRTAKTADKVTA
jgi:hypothetical protein